MSKNINRIAIVGTGVIGASWAALFLAKGLDVVATDIAPDAKAKLEAFIDAAWPALERLGLAPGASRTRLEFRRVLFRSTTRAVAGSGETQGSARLPRQGVLYDAHAGDGGLGDRKSVV